MGKVRVTSQSQTGITFWTYRYVEVSGRSDITDFEEVVRLDTKYINECSIGLDVKILVQTVVAVVKKRGAV